MTHPTDDELEAMAARLAHMGQREAAAMLRACKGGAGPDARQEGWRAGMDVRRWYFYPIEMPVTADGFGPATVGRDADNITYEVWDRELQSHATFDNLPDAINEAMRLNATIAEKGPDHD